MEYTKGEWLISYQNEYDLFIHDGKCSGAIARVYGENTLIKSREEAEANAKLIAAAPKLLEALIAITNDPDYLGNKFNFVNKEFVKAAIQKATA